MGNKPTPSPEQIKLWRELGQDAWCSDTSTDLTTHPRVIYAAGYLRAMTDQSAEIERLKTAISEVLEFQSSALAPSIHDFGRWRRILGIPKDTP